MTFKEYLELQGLSKHTVRGYLTDIKECVKKEILSEDFSVYNINNLVTKKFQKSTQKRYLASIKKYGNYLIKQGIIKKIPQPFNELRIKKGYKLPNIIEEQQLNNILNHEDTETSLLLNLLYTTGARISTVANLKIEDIKENHIEFNFSKGDKPYHSIITDKIKTLLNKHLKGRKEGYVFLTNGKKASSDCLRMRLKRTLKKDYINPHSLRHKIATDLFNNGADIYTVSNFLNHSDINTTKIYIHLSDKQRLQKLKGVHPMLSG